ncbi:MAG: hypothetical protein KGK16_00230 [Bradyrhizobium sp.]|nr:hypothetical protein [Bradyrhizobium sp.]
MKILFLATISLAAAIGSAKAQTPGQMPTNSPPTPASKMLLFTVKPADGEKEWTCEKGSSIQSLSAVRGFENKNVSVVFLDYEKKEILENTWKSAIGFRFKEKPEGEVRVRMICGG